MSALLIIGLKNAILVVPIALLAMAAGRWSRRPALAHLLWTLVLVKMLTPPLVHVPVGWQLDVASWLQTAPQTEPASDGHSFTSRSINRIRSAESKNQSIKSRRSLEHGLSVTRGGKSTVTAAPASLLSNLSWSKLWSRKVELLAAVWLLGSLLVLSKLIWRSYQFHRFLGLVERRHESLGPRAAELAARARIGIAPRVIVVDSVVSPMLWGMGRRACLVFPAKLVARLAPAELDALLLHELAHFARGDHWVRVLELVASVLYWWHPVFWWARHELEVAEEQCCDAWVVEHQSGEPISYAEALLATIDFLHEPAAVRPPIACGLGEVPFLRTRLTQIMRGEVAARLPVSVASLVLIGGLLCSPLEPALWASSSSGRSFFSFGTRGPASQVSPRANRASDLARIDSSVSTDRVPSLDSPAPQVEPVAVNETMSDHPIRLRPEGTSRSAAVLWAVAESSNGQYRMEARTGRQTRLASAALDLTSHQITCVSFAADSKTFITGHEDHIVRRWDSKSGGVMQSYKGCDSPITSVHFSPDGTSLAAGTQSGSVVVWDVIRGDEIGRREYPDSVVGCVRWSPAGDRLAISLGDWSNRDENKLVVWSTGPDEIVHEQALEQPVGALEWTESNGSLIAAGWDGYSQLISVRLGKVISDLFVDKDSVSAAAWSADCVLLNRGAELESRVGLNR